MNHEKESLIENLSLIYRLKEQAESMRKESDILLHGMRDILEATHDADVYDKMFTMFQKIIPFAYCFILVKRKGDDLYCLHSTDVQFAETHWDIDQIFDSVLAGEPRAILNVALQPAWQNANLPEHDAKSVMYCPLREANHTSVLVFCAKDVGFYTQEHVSIARKYLDFIEQTIMSVKAKLDAMATQRLRQEKERVKRSMIQSERMASLGLLAAGVAHEINNPIGFVKSNVEYLSTMSLKVVDFHDSVQAILSSSEGNNSKLEQLTKLLQSSAMYNFVEDMPEICDEMIEGIERVADIVQSLKSFVRHGDEEKGIFLNIAKCVHNSLKVINSRLTNINVTVNCEPEMQAVGSMGPFNQVLVNLFANAADAMKGQGELKIALTEHTKELCLSVQDNGEGMSAETAAKIFEPFYTTKPQGKGTGLGLYISYTLMQSFGGRITVDSEPGLGTTFHLWLKKIPQ